MYRRYWLRSRITSYNVCYTKLLRHLLLDPVSWHMFWSDLEELVVEGAAAAAAPAATTPFRVWAGALAEHAKSAEVQASRKVLQALPWTAIKPIPLDTAADRFDDNSYNFV